MNFVVVWTLREVFDESATALKPALVLALVLGPLRTSMCIETTHKVDAHAATDALSNP